MAAELKQVKGNTWCITGTQYIPVYKTDEHHGILLDTGTNAFRKRLMQVLADNQITPVGIICSHTHYDHFGNARFLKEEYGIPLVLSIGEAEISRTVAGMKSHLFVYSIEQTRNYPELAGLPCRADLLIEEEQTSVTVAGVTFDILHTPGHSIDQEDHQQVAEIGVEAEETGPDTACAGQGRVDHQPGAADQRDHQSGNGVRTHRFISLSRAISAA